MGAYFVKHSLKRPPVHPGEILREDVLPTLCRHESQQELQEIR